jgi:archaellum component FlaC
LDIIDTTLSKLSNKVRRGKEAISVSKERLNEIKAKKKQLTFVPSMTKQFNRLEKTKIKLDKERAYFDSMGKSILDVQKYLLEIETLNLTYSSAQNVLKIGNKYRKVSGEIESLEQIVQDLRKNLSLADTEIPDIKQLISIAEEWKQLNNFCTLLSKQINEIVTERKKVCRKRKLLRTKKRKLKKMIGNTCPICGTKIKIKS